MKSKEKEFLPIGTVVLLKGGSKRIMICGFCCHGTGENDKLFDYVGCLSPEGFISSDKNLLFNFHCIASILRVLSASNSAKVFVFNDRDTTVSNSARAINFSAASITSFWVTPLRIIKPVGMWVAIQSPFALCSPISSLI